MPDLKDKEYQSALTEYLQSTKGWAPLAYKKQATEEREVERKKNANRRRKLFNPGTSRAGGLG